LGQFFARGEQWLRVFWVFDFQKKLLFSLQCGIMYFLFEGIDL
jgi:hypothetical protein